MTQMYQKADSKGRVALPGFANAILIIEKIDDTEYRIRRAKVIAEKDLHFLEEDFPLQLSARDAASVAEAMENPPAPNQAARRAAKRARKHHG
jgi:uncharacterized protein DUF1778